MSMEHWWHDIDGKTEELGKKLVPVPLVHHKSHMYWAGIKPGLHF
jgi:hypothetical protein